MSMKPLLTKVISAHVLGDYGLSEGETPDVVRANNLCCQIDNLFIHDSSLFLSCIVAEPQLSAYDITSLPARGPPIRLTGRDVVSSPPVTDKPVLAPLPGSGRAGAWAG